MTDDSFPSLREAEIKQLQGWQSTVEKFLEKIQAHLAREPGMPHHEDCRDSNSAATEDSSNYNNSEQRGQGGKDVSSEMELNQLRNHFHKEFRKQLYGEAEDARFFDWLAQVRGKRLVLHMYTCTNRIICLSRCSRPLTRAWRRFEWFCSTWR